jgi:hypothetical protein
MSTPTVTAETIALAREEGLHLVKLPNWYDVDDKASLVRLADEIEPEPFNNGEISADHTLPKQAMERQADAFLT